MGDSQIIKKCSITPKDKVLDVGGSMKQHREININTLVDFFHPEKVPYYPSKLKAKQFVKVDITRETLPFRKNEFDVCLCTHTLEDLHNPFLAMDEMQRVAKRGLIITPNRGFDMVFDKYNLTNWGTGARRIPGMAHHKWFFESDGTRLKVTSKNFPILYTSEFHITKWMGKDEMVFYWENNFDYSVEYGLSSHELVENYRRYVKRNNKKIGKSKVLFFIDNPYYIVKELAKQMFRREAKH